MVRHIKAAVIIAISLLSCWAASAQVQFTAPTAFTTGTEPSIAIDATGLTLEVHQSGDDTSFMFGQLSGQTVTWGPSKVFPWKMYNARVSRIDTLGSSLVILSYTGEPFGGGCFYRVGFINPRGLDGDFLWETGEEKWGACDYTLHSRIVFNSHDVLFGVYSDSSDLLSFGRCQLSATQLPNRSGVFGRRQGRRRRFKPRSTRGDERQARGHH
jgi:hypothetical protein